MRIRSRLLLLVSAVLLPALCGAAIALFYIYHEEQLLNHASMQETTRAMALALDRDTARRQAVLRTLADSPSLGRGPLNLFYGYAMSVAKDTDSAIILSDLEGRQIINTRLPFGARLPAMRPVEREFRARFGNEAVFISDLYTPPAGLGSYSFAIQMPVRRDGRVVQFLTMASFAGQLQKLLADQRLPEPWLASIVDRQGVIVARNIEPERYVGRSVREPFASRLAAEQEGSNAGTTLGGMQGTAFFSRAPASGWSLVVTVPHSALYGPANRAVVLMAAISLLLLALGAGAALSVGRRIARPVEALRAAAQRLGHNEPVQAASTGTDELDAVSHAMAEASERLRGTTAELERRVAEAVGSYEQSQRALVQAQKLEALGRLTGGIAHDFNNVLQTLTAGMAALKRSASGDQQTLLARCQRAISRGTELARQLMAFGRVQDIRAETIDTGARLAEARHLLGGALPADIMLEFELMKDLWPVTVDPAQLELSLLNLVINARDAMPGGGRLTLRARNETLEDALADLTPGDYVVLTLTDTGEGMSEEVMARALDPFYTTKGIGKGSGMGLPQAYGFARQNGGTLTLASRRGQGTTVTLYLPRGLEPLSERPMSGRFESVAAGQGKVLLVEDDDEVRDTVSGALRSAGFEIRTAATADEALRRIEGGESFDAVLTDVVMPGELSGIDLAEQLGRRHPRIGVVVATGYTDRAVHLPGVRALAKPYELQQMVDALNAAMTSKVPS